MPSLRHSVPSDVDARARERDGRRHPHPDYVRSVMFGLEDGLVSTTGAAVGIAAGTRDADVVLLAGVVVLAVEALSMAAGQFLSERTVHQVEPWHQDSLVVGTLLMFAAYVVAGLIPLAPVVLVRSMASVVFGAALAFPALFGLGWAKGRVVGVAPRRSGVEVLLVGGVAAAIGIAVGLFMEGRVGP